MGKDKETTQELAPGEEALPVIVIPDPKPRRHPGGRPKGLKGVKVSPAAKARMRKAKAMRLMAQGITPKAAAAATGISPGTAKNYSMELRAIYKGLEDLEEFRTHKIDILEGTLSTILKSANDPIKLDKASVNNLAYAARQFHEIKRLEAGQSTANVEVFHRVPLDSLRKPAKSE
jgi:hypothetical protein